jgi:hypothetical protein
MRRQQLFLRYFKMVGNEFISTFLAIWSGFANCNISDGCLYCDRLLLKVYGWR